MAKLTLRTFCKESDKAALEKLLHYVNKASKEAKLVIDFYLNPDPEAEFEKAKRKLDRELSRPRLPSTQTCKKIIQDFIKLDADDKLAVELHFFYVTELLAIIDGHDLGGHEIADKTFEVYCDLTEYLEAHNLTAEFRTRLNKLTKRAKKVIPDFDLFLGDVYLTRK